MSRREKIEALLKSPNEGERAAAQAALARLGEAIPKSGTPEYFAQTLAWNKDIDWAVSRLGTPELTPQEIRTIRNIAKYRGTPWSRGSDAFKAVFAKLQELERAKGTLALEIVYTEKL